MVKLQHRDRREGGITVGDPPTRYELDSEGIVEVSEEHAKMLAGVGMWKAPGVWPGVAAASAPPVADSPAGRRPRTRAELEAAAAAEGLVVPEASSPVEAPAGPTGPEPTPEPTPVVAADPAVPETIEVSANMTLEQLRGVANQLGLKVPKRISQAALFELIKAQGEAS